MKQKFSKIYQPLFQTKARYIHIWGGRARGGSHAATDFMLYHQTQPQYFRGFFLREVLGDVRASLWQDYKDRLEAAEANENDFSLAEVPMRSVHLPTGNIINSKGFKKSSGKSTAKLKSIAGATHILIEEAEEISEEDFLKLDDSLRTTKGQVTVVLLFNPPSKDHWIIKRWYNLTEAKEHGKTLDGWYVATPKKDPNLLSIFSTYKHNRRNLDDQFVANLEAYGNPDSSTYNTEHYYSVVKGYVSEGLRGRIYKGWKPMTVAEFRALPYPSFYGHDFGYSEDPNATIEVKVHNNNLYFHEVLYEKGLTNPTTARKLKLRKVGKAPIAADSAEPKSVEELRLLGLNVVKAKKGPDSIVAGIKKIKSFKVHYTETSSNLESEYQNYRWELDNDKVPTDTPEDKNNHLMDAARYAVMTFIDRPTTKTTVNGQELPKRKTKTK